MRLAQLRVYLVLALTTFLLAAKKSDPTFGLNWSVILHDLGIMIGLILLALTLDYFVLRFGIRKLESIIVPKIKSSQKVWVSFSLKLLLQIARILMWIAVIYTNIRVSQIIDPYEVAILDSVTNLVSEFAALFNSPLLELGRNKISLGFLVLLIILSVAVFFVSHWLSEWFKISILKSLQVERGAQETITRIISYTLTLIGLLVLLQTVGIDLSSLTVVAGVLGIGIGFGLQNLASNFVSGIAILIEQPIKVGDFIEVDGLSGTVEKISIRSTVVRTNDSQFVIVPNNRFIDKNVINWSYRNPDSRLHIPVGVAYGSNTGTVTEALLNAARKDSRILLYPPPSVWFKGFGDSAFLFELLVWINRPQDAEPIKSAMNFLIEQELNRKGIEIPFPQRDIYVHNWEGTSRSLRNVSPSQGSPQPDLSPSTPTRQHRELRNMLQKVTYFQHCSQQQLDSLIEQGEERFYPIGQIIFRPGDPGDEIYLILVGTVETRSERLNQSLATSYAGESFGEISVLTGMNRLSTVTAVENTTVFVIKLPALKALLQNDPHLAEQIASDVTAHQRVLQELGLITDEDDAYANLPSLNWLRQRMKALFTL